MDRQNGNNSKCSDDVEPISSNSQTVPAATEIPNLSYTGSEVSREIATHSLEDAVQSSRSSDLRVSGKMTPSLITMITNEGSTTVPAVKCPLPFLLMDRAPTNAPSSVVGRTAAGTKATRHYTVTIQSPISSQPLLSTSKLNGRPQLMENWPQSLFILSLAKLNETYSMNVTVLNNLIARSHYLSFDQSVKRGPFPGDLTPPDSLTSAPPSYSYVLRQMAVRRRPRLMGTFIPSPSFIPHVPPPNYNAAFDIYIDGALSPPTARVRRFGFTSMPVVCPECGYAGMSVVTSKVTICTHLCAVILCILCCWLCAPLPYVLRSCKDVYHHCRNCRNFLGLYCPTNADGTLP